MSARAATVLCAASTLFGCCTHDEPSIRESPGQAQESPERQPGVVVTDGYVRSLPGLELKVGAIREPDEADRALAQKIAPAIRDLGIEYLKKLRPRDTFSLSAARETGEFILLCYSWAGKDGDAFLVYSTKARKIVGQFCWYEQG